jgi:bacterioferritin
LLRRQAVNEVLRALRKMHNVERFAVEIYRTQIRAFPEKEIADRLKVAMANEQEHVNDLQARIRELGGTCSWLGFFFQMAGKLLGFTTTLIGKMFLLKADIRIEKRAVEDYDNFLQKVDFDEKSRGLIQKNLEDEKAHIKRWEESVEILQAQR